MIGISILKREIMILLAILIGFTQTGSVRMVNERRVDSQVESISGTKLSKERNYLKYKTVSTTVWGKGGIYIPSVDVYNHLAFQGADNTLVVMIDIKGDTDANPVMLPDSIVNQALENAAIADVKTTMLKLHLGMNYSDGYSRKSYHPDANAFFKKWKNICLHYAQICTTNNIPILCIGCEQVQQTVDANYSYWADIVSAIRRQYPNLLLTYAAHGDEYKVDTPLKFWRLFDFIGFNMYFHYTDKLVSQNPTLDEIIKSYYAPVFNGKSIMDLINMHANTFNKKIFITETGLMPKDAGLIRAYDPANASDPTTYDGTALAIKAVFDGLCQNDNVLGLSWWHVNQPFDYFNDDEVTSAEQTMHDYLKGGLI